ncbi:MAG TPA: alpha/beta fold hydrolase, partial [Candidatus Binataceae bacterium]|nr:alpha/beta fold hydrolase [Candidatus Binataceae bacterium]
MPKVTATGEFPGEPAPGRRPSLVEVLGEFRAPFEATSLWLQAFAHKWPHAEPGKGQTVLLIPGFMAGDVTLAPLANFLRYLGHRPVTSGIWSNSSCPRELLVILVKRLEVVTARFGAPTVIIGHSLGGIYARELAHRAPQMVSRVITLGAPITRPRDHANHAIQAVANSLAALRGRAKGCLSENCSCGLRLADEAPRDIPSTSIYSKTDGIV